MPDMKTLHRELKAARQELHNLQVAPFAARQEPGTPGDAPPV
jgi:hypothetical protein